MWNFVNLPLYSDADYFYVISLERVAYKIRFYFNERRQGWVVDLRYADNTPIVLGEALVANYPMFLDYGVEDLSGFFLLSPIGDNKNETTANSLEINEYYTFRYYWEV